MKLVNWGILSLLFLVFSSTTANAKDARIGSCGGTQLSFKTAKKACASGNFPGQTIVTCKKNGKQVDRRICNSDGAKSGVYVNTCAGTATGFTNLKKACQSENFFGSLLVKCKRGEEKSRMQCESADSEDGKVAIFQDRCGSGPVIAGKNLLKVCKSRVGETLVKCKRKNNIWKEKKVRHCMGNKDRFKFKKCSPSERATLISDYELAESRVEVALQDLESLLATDQTIDKKLRKKMEKVRKKLEKIQRAMDRPRVYACKANKNLCQGANAHTLTTGKKVKICDNYFNTPTQLERASILVHEISHHKTQTNDKGTEHGGCTSPVLAPASSNFHKQAEYYEHLVECGLYLPN